LSGKHVGADSACVRPQRFANFGESPSGDLILKTLGQLVDHIDEDLGVADSRQRPPGVTQTRVGLLIQAGRNVRPNLLLWRGIAPPAQQFPPIPLATE
jgi:hypothetical protein